MGDVLRIDGQRLARVPPDLLREAVDVALKMLAPQVTELQTQVAALTSTRNVWLTVAQVVEQTGVTHCTVRGWIRDGALKATHWGRSHQWRIRASDLESFLKGERHV